MKKIFAVTLTILLVLVATAPAFASGLPRESKDYSVIYTNNCDGVTVPAEDGTATGKLPADTAFSAENLPDNTKHLRVYPVQSKENDVLKWIEDSLADEYDAAVTYYVACTDADAKEISNKGARVTVDAPKTKDALTVYAIDETGKATAIIATVTDGKTTFTATGAQLYAFCVATKNPSTSDGSVAIFLLFSITALTVGAGIFAKTKKES